MPLKQKKLFDFIKLNDDIILEEKIELFFGLIKDKIHCEMELSNKRIYA